METERGALQCWTSNQLLFKKVITLLTTSNPSADVIGRSTSVPQLLAPSVAHKESHTHTHTHTHVFLSVKLKQFLVMKSENVTVVQQLICSDASSLFLRLFDKQEERWPIRTRQSRNQTCGSEVKQTPTCTPADRVELISVWNVLWYEHKVRVTSFYIKSHDSATEIRLRLNRSNCQKHVGWIHQTAAKIHFDLMVALHERSRWKSVLK